MSDNPLKRLYRHKSYYTQLPSGGRFYNKIKLSVDGEIGVMPLTAADEIKLKSPDALFNGEALVDLFRSCVPDIGDPENIPTCDIDPLLIAIRAASTESGEIEISSQCTNCNETESYQIDLKNILATVKPIPKDTSVTLADGVSVEVRPSPLSTTTKTQVEAFFQYRMQQALNNDDLDNEAKAKIFDEALMSSISLQIAQVADSIVSVTLPAEDDDTDNILVDNYEHISDWARNMDRETHKIITDKIKELNRSGIDSEVAVQCPHCEHNYKTKIELNPANFF